MITLPLTFTPPAGLRGATDWGEIQRFYPGDKIRQIERASIRTFMEKHKPYLRGRVLDFGAGQQPYKDLVSAEYVPFERGDSLRNSETGSFDAVMCNQVLQYVGPDTHLLYMFRDLLKPSGYLIMTYATNWAEVEDTDLVRFTKAGMSRLLAEAGLIEVAHELRAEVAIGSFTFVLGYGVVCHK